MPWQQVGPPGWYPDPSGQPVHRWWDGFQWTSQVQPWPTPLRQHSTAWVSTAFGGVAAFIGAFLPWVHVFLVGTLDLFQVVSKGGGSLLALLVIIGAVVLAVIGIFERSAPTRPSSSTLVLEIAICGAALTGLWGVGLNADVRGATGFASLGAGVFVTFGGFVVAAVGAGRSKVTAGATSPPANGPTPAPADGWAVDGPPEPPPLFRNPGWYPDPWGFGRLRYWSGTNWTREVRQGPATPGKPGEEGPSEPRPPSVEAGWYRDPWGIGHRYWNGSNWTRTTR